MIERKLVLDHPDFTGVAGFKIHTRWIETDFAGDLNAAPRPAPLPDPALLRTAIEIDGRRVTLGLPAGLLAGLTGLAGQASGAMIPANAAPTNPPEDPATITAPVSGTLQAWKVAQGETVQPGQHIATLEAMKMEMQITAPHAGRLTHLTEAGTPVQAGQALGRIEVVAST